MQNAVAFSDNDVIVIAWSYGKKPEGCMGFAVYRIDESGTEEPLPSHAVFKGYKIAAGQTTADFPVQKFYWKDPYARLIADKTGKRSFRYKIVPLEGKPGALGPMRSLPFIVSNEVEIGARISEKVSAYFNRGLISTQRVSRALKGKADKGSLLARVADAEDPLRESLAGDMAKALTGFLDRAKDSGEIYAALYELGDEELVERLESLGDRLHIVLSNSLQKDGSDGNEPARRRLEASRADKSDRMMPKNHIGHNKFLVYVDKGKKARACLYGSTNWTSTGLCTQTNNTIVADEPDLAARYLAYWNRLAKDTQAAGDDSKELQGAALRKWDAAARPAIGLGSAEADSRFSPCTPKQRSSKPKPDEPMPPDMKEVVKRIDGARKAVLFLAFNPGTPGIENWTAAALKKSRKEGKELFVRGCVTNSSAAEGFYYSLKGMAPPPKPKPAKGEKAPKAPSMQDPRVIAAEALRGGSVPEGWQEEILNAGFAIVHDKILVVDPFSDSCSVVTGSHNLGYKASYDNDENLVIVDGDKRLAMAYATHVLDVYDHFSWRWQIMRRGGAAADMPLSDRPDDWLGKYFDASGSIRNAQLGFWMDAAAALP